MSREMCVSTVYVGLLLLLCPGVAPFQLRTPGMCSARQPTFLSEPPTLMCAADASTSSAPLLTALGDARTILTCAKCKAAFPIDPEAFGSGRRVRCNNCDHEWYQTADRLQVSAWVLLRVGRGESKPNLKPNLTLSTPQP